MGRHPTRREPDEAISLDKQICDEQKQWKRNMCFMYDLVMTHALPWPSLTFDWLPDLDTCSHPGESVHACLVSTHTLDDTSSVEVTRVHVPDGGRPPVGRQPIELEQRLGCAYPVVQKVKTAHSIVHRGSVIRARAMPQNPNIIATRTRLTGDAYIFDYHNNHRCSQEFLPDFVLSKHSGGGYGLSWNRQRAGLLATCGTDDLVNVWDVNAFRSKVNEPAVTFTGHEGSVNDVQWQNAIPTILLSVGQDKCLKMWDTRRKSRCEPCSSVTAHSQPINGLSVNPVNDVTVATCSDDKTVALWDLRNLSVKLHTLTGHVEDVVNVSWSPHFENLLLSTDSLRGCIVWDLSRINDYETPPSGHPAELLLRHCGHSATISDIAWNPNEPGLIGSVSEDNIMQLWQLSASLLKLPPLSGFAMGASCTSLRDQLNAASAPPSHNTPSCK